MSIYENIEEYARVTRMGLEQAKARCEYFLAVKKEINESLKCPECGKCTLIPFKDEESNELECAYCEDCDFDNFDSALEYARELDNGATVESLFHGYYCSWEELLKACANEIKKIKKG